LGYETPNTVYETAAGGGAMIVDKFGKGANLPVALRSTGMPSDDEPIEMQAIPNPKTRGSAVQLRVKSSAT
jgi:hypothetical protein